MRVKASIAALILTAFITSCSGCTHVSQSVVKPARPLTRAETFTKIHEAMVRISLFHPERAESDPSSAITFSGSGEVFYSSLSGSLVLTAFHVVDDVFYSKTELLVLVGYLDADNKMQMFPARIVKADSKLDLAVLAVPKLMRPVMKIADVEPGLYDELFVMGSPEAWDGAVATAVLFNKKLKFPELQMDEKGNKIEFRRDLWGLSNTSVIFGVSGGAVTNGKGELVCNANSTLTTDYMTNIDSDYNNPESRETRARINLPFTQIGFCVPLPVIKGFVQQYLK